MLLFLPVILLDILIQFPVLIFTLACRSITFGEEDLFPHVD